MNQPLIPKNLKTIYPNPEQEVFGTQAVIFRDHRWTLPVIFCACEDDDWIVAGMELGIIADVVQFKSDFVDGSEGEPFREHRCDFFTVSWDTYTIPFADDMYTGEFLCSCQSTYYDAYTPLRFLQALIRNASVITMATEPDFCGGAEKSSAIVTSVNRFLLDSTIDEERILIDYPPVYPNE